MRAYDKRLMDRTCRIIDRGGYILLKRRDDWYLHQHTNVVAGYDAAIWGRREAALHIDTIELAFILVQYFNDCRVVVFYPRGKK